MEELLLRKLQARLPKTSPPGAAQGDHQAEAEAEAEEMAEVLLAVAERYACPRLHTVCAALLPHAPAPEALPAAGERGVEG